MHTTPTATAEPVTTEHVSTLILDAFKAVRNDERAVRAYIDSPTVVNKAAMAGATENAATAQAAMWTAFLQMGETNR